MSVELDSDSDVVCHTELDQDSDRLSSHEITEDGVITQPGRSGSGHVSPIRSRTIKEYDQQIAELQKENFSLKLRIYFLEERMRKPLDENGEDINKININLKVEVESLKHELDSKQELLKKASNALTSMTVQHQVEIEVAREQAVAELRARAHRDAEAFDALASDLRQQLSDVSDEVELFRGRLLESQSKVDELLQVVETLDASLKQSEKSRADLERKLEQIIDANNEKVADFEDEIAAKDKLISELKSALDVKDDLLEQAAVDKKESLNVMKQQFKKQISELNKKLETRSEDDEHSAEMIALHDQCNELRRLLRTAQRDNEVLRRQSQQRELEAVGLSKQLDKMDVSLQNKDTVLLRLKELLRTQRQLSAARMSALDERQQTAAQQQAGDVRYASGDVVNEQLRTRLQANEQAIQEVLRSTEVALGARDDEIRQLKVMFHSHAVQFEVTNREPSAGVDTDANAEKDIDTTTTVDASAKTSEDFQTLLDGFEKLASEVRSSVHARSRGGVHKQLMNSILSQLESFSSQLTSFLSRRDPSHSTSHNSEQSADIGNSGRNSRRRCLPPLPKPTKISTSSSSHSSKNLPDSLPSSEHASLVGSAKSSGHYCSAEILDSYSPRSSGQDDPNAGGPTDGCGGSLRRRASSFPRCSDSARYKLRHAEPGELEQVLSSRNDGGVVAESGTMSREQGRESDSVPDFRPASSRFPNDSKLLVEMALEIDRLKKELEQAKSVALIHSRFDLENLPVNHAGRCPVPLCSDQSSGLPISTIGRSQSITWSNVIADKITELPTRDRQPTDSMDPSHRKSVIGTDAGGIPLTDDWLAELDSPRSTTEVPVDLSDLEQLPLVTQLRAEIAELRLELSERRGNSSRRSSSCDALLSKGRGGATAVEDCVAGNVGEARMDVDTLKRILQAHRRDHSRLRLHLGAGRDKCHTLRSRLGDLTGMLRQTVAMASTTTLFKNPTEVMKRVEEMQSLLIELSFELDNINEIHFSPFLEPSDGNNLDHMYLDLSFLASTDELTSSSRHSYTPLQQHSSRTSLHNWQRTGPNSGPRSLRTSPTQPTRPLQRWKPMIFERGASSQNLSNVSPINSASSCLPPRSGSNSAKLSVGQLLWIKGDLEAVLGDRDRELTNLRALADARAAEVDKLETDCDKFRCQIEVLEVENKEQRETVVRLMSEAQPPPSGTRWNFERQDLAAAESTSCHSESSGRLSSSDDSCERVVADRLRELVRENCLTAERLTAELKKVSSRAAQNADSATELKDGCSELGQRCRELESLLGKSTASFSNFLSETSKKEQTEGKVRARYRGNQYSSLLQPDESFHGDVRTGTAGKSHVSEMGRVIFGLEKKSAAYAQLPQFSDATAIKSARVSVRSRHDNEAVLRSHLVAAENLSSSLHRGLNICTRIDKLVSGIPSHNESSGIPTVPDENTGGFHSLEKYLDDMRQLYRQLEESLQKNDRLREVLERNMDDEGNDRRQHLQVLECDLARLAEENEVLRSEKELFEKLLDDARRQIESLQMEINEQRSRAEESSELCRALRLELQAVRKENTSATANVQQCNRGSRVGSELEYHLLTEVQLLRVQLERCIVNNDILRDRLEDCARCRHVAHTTTRVQTATTPAGQNELRRTESASRLQDMLTMYFVASRQQFEQLEQQVHASCCLFDRLALSVHTLLQLPLFTQQPPELRNESLEIALLEYHNSTNTLRQSLAATRYMVSTFSLISSPIPLTTDTVVAVCRESTRLKHQLSATQQRLSVARHTIRSTQDRLTENNRRKLALIAAQQQSTDSSLLQQVEKIYQAVSQSRRNLETVHCTGNTVA